MPSSASTFLKAQVSCFPLCSPCPFQLQPQPLVSQCIIFIGNIILRHHYASLLTSQPRYPGIFIGVASYVHVVRIRPLIWSDTSSSWLAAWRGCAVAVSRDEEVTWPGEGVVRPSVLVPTEDSICDYSLRLSQYCLFCCILSILNTRPKVSV